MSQRPTELQYNPDASTIEYRQGSNVFTCALSASSVVWGTITGTLSNQSDLQTALNLLAPLTSPTFLTSISLGASMVIKPVTNGTSATQFTQSNGTSVIMDLDSTNRRVGILTNTPSQPLEVNGNVSIDGQIVMGGGAPSAACLIDMLDSYAGLGLPVLTTTQMNAVSPARAGNVIWNSTANALYGNNGTSWAAIGGSSGLVLQCLSTASKATDTFTTGLFYGIFGLSSCDYSGE